MHAGSHSDSPELDAQLLVCHVLTISRARLYAYPEQVLSTTDIDTLNALLARRTDGEPLAYLVGAREFWSRSLDVTEGVLVPRPDTEILVEKAIELAKLAPEGVIVDLGTGSGAIAIAMALELPRRQFIAVEKSAAALSMAQRNITSHAPDTIQLVKASWLDSFADTSVAMVVSNPPYLAENDPHLPALKHEPRDALVSGSSGFEDLEHIIRDTLRVARNGAPLILEHGSEQGAAVRELMVNYSYTNVDMALDLAGHERISFGFVAKQTL